MELKPTMILVISAQVGNVCSQGNLYSTVRTWQKIELLKLATEGDWEQNIKREQVDEGGTVALACQPVLAAAPLG